MTPTRARRIVVLALAATAAVTVARKLTDRSLPRPQILVGAFVAGILLAALADVAPGVAAGLAITALIAGAISAGPDPFDQLATSLRKDN